MPRRSASEPTLGAPGSVWVWHGAGALASQGKKIVQKPPKHEAQAVAWKAARKPTLYGQLGTYNKISSVIQYPISSKDPFNMCQSQKGHLSAEDRRLMRVMIKHELRHSRHYPDGVYEIERKLIDAFGKSAALRAHFYSNEDYAKKLLGELVFTLDTNGSGKMHDHEEPLNFESEASLVPKRHDLACGPQCYCLKFQDAALLAKMPPDASVNDDFLDTFANKSKNAAATLVQNLAASRRKTMERSR
mmetsp:Transcript_41491/g.65811  ORF Transcript_41491/g.65811 Transcript_41491/m.65811 type:complete len:246 (+) Transcript_41491:71-808(+)